MLLPQQVAVWRRDTFWQREPKSQNNPPRRTEPRPSGSLFWLTIRRPLLRCGPLGPCCLRRRLQLRGRAGGALNFFSKLCFQSCFWTLSSCTHSVWLRTPLLCSKTDWRESAPSKLLSKSSSMCGDLPESSRTRGQRARKFFKISALPNFSANRGQIRRTTGEITTCPVAATQQTGVSNVLCTSPYLSEHGHLSLRHNRPVYHSITLCTDAMDRSVASLPRNVSIETKLN